MRIEGPEDRIEEEVDGSRFGGVEASIRACILERRLIVAWSLIENYQFQHCRSSIGLYENPSTSPQSVASIAYNHQEDKRDDNDDDVCVEADVRFDGNGVGFREVGESMHDWA